VAIRPKMSSSPGFRCWVSLILLKSIRDWYDGEGSIILTPRFGRACRSFQLLGGTLVKIHTGLLIVALLGLMGSANYDMVVSLATAPPVVVRAVPESGTDGVDPGLAEIKVTYSKDMMDRTWSWSTWGQGTFPDTTGKPHYLIDKRTCVLPVKLKPGKMYAIWLNSNNFGNFKDATGHSAVPYLLVFKTKP